MDEPDLERAVSSVLAEPIPASLSVGAVQRRAQRLRRRQQTIAGLAACLVVLLVGSLALTVRHESSVSVTADEPAPVPPHHTNRYRFVGEGSDAARQATVDRIRARYEVLGHAVTTAMVSSTEFTITDTFTPERSETIANALTIIGATSLGAVT